MRERMKTVSVALVICLNVGVDPPDVTKTQPCARTECWVDPTTLNPQRAIEQIGNNLQKQYERWQPRARYKLSLDPPLEEVRRLATGLRRNAREERVLFHYNGHGVPKPTANGEIWVFNRNYTQYIPLSLYDLQSWMGSPSIFVYDCSNAGIIVQAFEQFADQHEREYLEQINSQVLLLYQCGGFSLRINELFPPLSSPGRLLCGPASSNPAAQLHPASGLLCHTDPPHEPRPAGRPLHVVPDHPDQDGAAMVCHAGPWSPGTQRHCRHAGQDPRTVRGQAHHARRAQLDLHGHHRHHRLEHLAQGSLPEALQTRSPSGVALQKLPPCREDHEESAQTHNFFLI